MTENMATEITEVTVPQEPEKKKHGKFVAFIIGLGKFIGWLLRMLWKLLKAM